MKVTGGKDEAVLVLERAETGRHHHNLVGLIKVSIHPDKHEPSQDDMSQNRGTITLATQWMGNPAFKVPMTIQNQDLPPQDHCGQACASTGELQRQNFIRAHQSLAVEVGELSLLLAATREVDCWRTESTVRRWRCHQNRHDFARMEGQVGLDCW